MLKAAIKRILAGDMREERLRIASLPFGAKHASLADPQKSNRGGHAFTDASQGASLLEPHDDRLAEMPCSRGGVSKAAGSARIFFDFLAV